MRLLLVLLLSFLLASFAVASDRPNVILIVADDFGWADLECYGSTYHRTPNADRLAQEGMRFTHAYAACPVCSPTRAAIMTGKYPARLHLTDWLPGRRDLPSQALLRPDFRQELPREEVTLAELLKQVGYKTASIGKWHLGGEGYGPTEQGFDHNVGGDHMGSPLSYFAPYERNGRTIPGLEDAPTGEYLTDRLYREAERFIESNRDQPFFLYLPHYAVHTPMSAKQELAAKYQGTTSIGKQANPIYAAMIESVDQGLGRLLQLLEELGIDQRTVLLFTSDNGGLATIEGKNTPATINAPLREGKGYLYEGGIRVPLLVKWPNAVKPGSICDQPVSSIDLLATIAEICQVPSVPAIDGVSLVPLLKQTGNLDREALYWHYPHYSNQGGAPGGAIRVGAHKLIEFYEQGRLELFDVVSDPSESRNLIEKQPQIASRLAKMLADWRDGIEAQAMQPNPEYLPNPQNSRGIVDLPARTARVHGEMLRYEPLPHKNTLGFWVNVDDWASWDFTLTQPGTFRLVVLQGCGHGSGGSEVELGVGEQTLTMTVEETGGFQVFKEREIGNVTLPTAGKYTLTVKPKSKPKAAVMDLRQVRLVPLEKP